MGGGEVVRGTRIGLVGVCGMDEGTNNGVSSDGSFSSGSDGLECRNIAHGSSMESIVRVRRMLWLWYDVRNMNCLLQCRVVCTRHICGKSTT